MKKFDYFSMHLFFRFFYIFAEITKSIRNVFLRNRIEFIYIPFLYDQTPKIDWRHDIFKKCVSLRNLKSLNIDRLIIKILVVLFLLNLWNVANMKFLIFLNSLSK